MIYIWTKSYIGGKDEQRSFKGRKYRKILWKKR